jgi:N-acetylmuramoyl-L-alanine amidase
LNSRSLSFICVATVAGFGFLAQGISSQTPPGPSLTLLSRDGRRPLPISIVETQEFVALDDLATAFQLVVHEETFGAITVSYKGKTVVLTADQTLASVSGRLISLPAPPTRSGRRWLVPVEFISRALAPIYDSRLDLRKPSRLVVVGDLRVPRLTVRYDPLGATGRLTIDATPRAASSATQDADHLTIKFEADALDVPNPPLMPPGGQGLVQAVRQVDATTLAVDLGPRFSGFKVTTEPVDTTMRMVIDIVAAPTDAAAAPAPPAPPPSPELPPGFIAPTAAVRTIALDPGHGGEDEGARGSVGGAKEKDITLSVARRVKAAIEARLGVRVLMTRDDDRNISIDERTAIANNNKADLFISLHVNASMRRTTSGASILCAAFDAATVQAGMHSTGERIPTFGGGLRDIELVPWNLAQIRHLDQSTAFAAIVEQRFRDRIPLASQAIDRAPLRVLESANMPAVLIEIGYLTNADQEKLLTGDAFQNTFTQAMYDAVVHFRDSLGAGGTR